MRTTYTIASLIEAVTLELEMSGDVPGMTFKEGANWALDNLAGRATRADQLHSLINGSEEKEVGDVTA